MKIAYCPFKLCHLVNLFDDAANVDAFFLSFSFWSLCHEACAVALSGNCCCYWLSLIEYELRNIFYPVMSLLSVTHTHTHKKNTVCFSHRLHWWSQSRVHTALTPCALICQSQWQGTIGLLTASMHPAVMMNGSCDDLWNPPSVSNLGSLHVCLVRAPRF